MADHDDGLVELAEVVLQPVAGLEVEVVGGLVEQHQVGGRDELRGEPEPAALAAAQARERTGARFRGIEAQPLQHRVDPGAELVAALVREALQVVAVAGRGRPR